MSYTRKNSISATFCDITADRFAPYFAEARSAIRLPSATITLAWSTYTFRIYPARFRLQLHDIGWIAVGGALSVSSIVKVRRMPKLSTSAVSKPYVEAATERPADLNRRLIEVNRLM
ncbi:hypothetical protein [Flavisphingomonas formosensis]|uniref:hypothetical protein n=1 Tax=Flavisphingomonas formosensis TaxID=861534 RepID=UPI0012FBFF1B|nr:hypothetical protein [Sphingomonas formosensis]